MNGNDTRVGEVSIKNEGDIVMARKKARDLSQRLGFGVTDVTRIVTTVSELARNIYRFAGTGTMRWKVVNEGADGIEIIFEDKGPGISDIEQAMGMGFTSGRGLGMGLPGAKRLMDEMEIESQVGVGTMVTVRKWLRRI
jgi:serine/threonine-protein kinase RsbT